VSESFRVGVVGARGFTGAELIGLLGAHPELELVYAGSRELAGTPVPNTSGLSFQNLGTEEIASIGMDAVFLALPNGVSQPFVETLGEDTVIIDISSDHRLDDQWAYGLPELFRDKIAGARLIANPGCYATAMQLSLAPFVDHISAIPASFGVSGFSGAGTSPSPKNDPERLADNLIPYSLVGHNHEVETSHHLNHAVRFMPHVHPAFRGLMVTTHIPVSTPTTREEAKRRIIDKYGNEPLIDYQDDTPELRDGANRLGVVIGGLEVSGDGLNIVIVAAEDNLLKGAAVQAVQNLNLALGLGEYTAIL
jgi:N-acetyl-gamma-glutamyl-phosphate reductase